MILVKNMSKPKRCIDCPILKISYQDADGYGKNYDYCGALKRIFNDNKKLDINLFKETLSECPIIEVKDERFERIEKELKANYRIMGIVGYKCPKCGQGNFINSETHCVYCGEPLIKDWL